MVATERLIDPSDDFRSAFPGLNFRDAYTLTTHGEQILITDPTYLADVYNSTDEAAAFLREKGVFLMQFGGDVRCPVWWQPPYLILPISNSIAEDEMPPADVEVLANEVFTDSGSFIFLPLTTELHPEVEDKVHEALREESGVALSLPAGRWRFYYEQFPAPGENLVGLYRNVIAHHEGGG